MFNSYFCSRGRNSGDKNFQLDEIYLCKFMKLRIPSIQYVQNWNSYAWVDAKMGAVEQRMENGEWRLKSEDWRTGRMEYWKVGVLGDELIKYSPIVASNQSPVL